MTTEAHAVRLLLDRVELQDLVNRYCDALDHRQFELLDQVFTQDVVGDWPRNRRTVGREALLGLILFAFRYLGPTHHQIGNFSATVDGDVADVAVHVRAYHAGSGELSHLFEESLAEFRAHAVRKDEGWRFDRWGEDILVVLGTRDVFQNDRP